MRLCWWGPRRSVAPQYSIARFAPCRRMGPPLFGLPLCSCGREKRNRRSSEKSGGSPGPCWCELPGTRTQNPRLKRPLLCQLSYSDARLEYTSRLSRLGASVTECGRTRWGINPAPLHPKPALAGCHCARRRRRGATSRHRADLSWLAGSLTLRRSPRISSRYQFSWQAGFTLQAGGR